MLISSSKYGVNFLKNSSIFECNFFGVPTSLLLNFVIQLVYLLVSQYCYRRCSFWCIYFFTSHYSLWRFQDFRYYLSLLFEKKTAKFLDFNIVHLSFFSTAVIYLRTISYILNQVGCFFFFLIGFFFFYHILLYNLNRLSVNIGRIHTILFFSNYIVLIFFSAECVSI